MFVPVRRLALLILSMSLSFSWSAEHRVLILGDSITFAGGWATLVESGLRRTPDFSEATIINAGLPSETVSGLSEPDHAGGKFPRPCLHERLSRVLASCKPTLVLACYGMNDGIYLERDPVRQAAYQTGMTTLHDAVIAAQARFIAITPPLFSADHPPGKNNYDLVLDAYSSWLVSRRTDGWEVVETRTALRQAVADAKAKDPGFIYAKDSVHPGTQGHRFIALATWAGLAPLLGLKLDTPFAAEPALGTLTKRHEVLKLAWLTETKHLRPGIPAGLPLGQAETKADELLTLYRQQTLPGSPATP